MKKLAWIIFVSSCILFSFQPIKYLLADGPIGLLNSKPLDSYMYKASFYIHITFGGIALLIGWLQFSKKFREKYLKLHRVIGKIYVTSILISGPFAFYIGFFVFGGVLTQIGFTLGALFWIFFTYLGYYSIRKGNVAKHKEYMMYSYAGTFAAVTLRLWLPILMAITSFKIAYGISVWLSWLPNVFVAYLIIHKKDTLIAIYKKYSVGKILIATVVIIASIFVISYMSPQTWFYKSASYEGKSFKKLTANATTSFTQEKRNEIEHYLKEEAETTSMLVLENNKIVFEYGDISEISTISSTRGSILSMLYGNHKDNGTINLQETIGNIGMDEDYGLLAIEKQATIEHLITARSGVFYPSNNQKYSNNLNQKRGNVQPGAYFLDNNWDFNAAGYALEKKLGKTVYEELEEQLAIPLEFQDWNIQNQSKTLDIKKSRYADYNMHLSTRDMAKIGQLMLQKGKWNGKQLISKEWIQKITSKVTSVDTVRVRNKSDISSPLQQSYGYMWWIFERFYDNPDFEGAYTTWGDTGQFITVIPKRNVVVVHKTKLDILSYLGLSNRTKTPSWRYWWILRKLMLNRKSIAELSPEKSADEIIEFIKNEYQKDSEYAISERLINEYGQSLADEEKDVDALKFFELNLELYPHGYYTHRILNYYANSLMKLNRNKEALKAFETSLKFNSDNPIAKEMILTLKQ